MTTIIFIVETFIEFKKVEKPKLKDKGGKGKSVGDPYRGKETIDKVKGPKKHKVGERSPLKCFFCEGPHRARECPKRAKLSTLIEEHGQEEEKVASLQLLNSIKAKVEVPKN